MTEQTTSTDLAPIEIADDRAVNTLSADIDAMRQGKVAVFSSYRGESRDDKMNVLRAMTNSTALDTMIGKTVALANFVVQSIEMPDQNTGEMQTVPRIIIVDSEGKSYHAISQGIWSALKNICGILGMPATWSAPVDVTVAQEKTNSGYRVFTLKIK